MKILAICKDTGYNFIRHYTKNMANTAVCLTRNPREAWQRIEAEKPDVVIFEWANDLTADVVQHRKPDAKVIVRIHDHEVSQVQADGRRRAERVNWSNVDAVWFINKAIQKQFHQQINSRIPSFFLPNAVDPDRFPLTEKRHKRAGLLSLHFRPRKGILRAVYLAQTCRDWDFYIRVRIPDKSNTEFWPLFEEAHRLSVHVPNLHWENREVVDVVLNNYPFDDLNEWYADKSVILSTSYHEGFHYTVAEGALTGAMPIVWNWPTAQDFWGPYVNVSNSINEAAARLNMWQPGAGAGYRDYVVNNYSPAVLVPVLLEQLARIKKSVPA